MEVVFARAAQLKLASIYEYLEQNTSEEFASAHIAKIRDEIVGRLTPFVKIGVAYGDELHRKITVQSVSSRYAVIYEINETQNFISVYQIYGKGEDW